MINCFAKKFYLSVLFLLVLSGCQSLPKSSLNNSYPPNNFTLSGRLSFFDKQYYHTFTFDWQQSTKDNWQIAIVHTNTPWNLNIIYENKNIWVNNMLLETTLAQFLKEQYQFSLPLEHIKQLIFSPNTHTENFSWQIKKVTTQNRFNHIIAKKIHLQNKNQHLRLIIL